MARTGVTLEEVAEAVKELEKRGERVTQLAVRRELGDRGSMSTLRDHLHTLRNRMVAERQPPQEVPPELNAAMEASLSTLWERAQSLARQDIEAIRKAAQGRVELAEREMEDLGRAFDEQCERLIDAETTLKDLKLRISESEQRRGALEAEKGEITRVNEALLSRLDTQAEAIEQLTRQVQGLEAGSARRVTHGRKKA